MTEMASFVQEVGFPMFVAVYLLFRIEPIIKSNTQAINNLAIVISNLNGVDGKDLPERLMIDN